MSSTLPASWGADPAVLPALQELTVQLHVEGGLPPEWARGFTRLTNLDMERLPEGLIEATPRGVTSSQLIASRKEDARPARQAGPAQQGAAQHGTAPPLPPEWASGFPRLEILTLSNLGLTGSLPQSWQLDGFPSLTGL